MHELMNDGGDGSKTTCELGAVGCAGLVITGAAMGAVGADVASSGQDYSDYIGLKRAGLARDDFIAWALENAGTKKQLGKIGLVGGAYSPENDKVYIGWNLTGYDRICAEGDCAAQATNDGVSPQRLLYTDTIRPRNLTVLGPCGYCQVAYPGAPGSSYLLNRVSLVDRLRYGGNALFGVSLAVDTYQVATAPTVERKVTTAVNDGFGMAGGFAGALGGAAAGQALIPIPFVGAGVGALVGGIVGASAMEHGAEGVEKFFGLG